MANEPLGWAVIGTGHMADGIAAAIDQVEGAHFIAVVSRDPIRAATFAARHGGARSHADLAAALAEPDIDAVYVGSPNALHVEHAQAVVGAGRHVLCDKPLATDPDAARDLVKRAASASVVLGINLQMRHVPAARQVRAWIASGRIGRPVLARATLAFGHEELVGWRADPDLAVAGALYNLGVHAVDLVRFVLDDAAVSVNAVRAPRDAVLDRTILMAIRFRSGTLASVTASQELPVDDVSLHVVGTEGSIRWDGWMSPYRQGRLSLRQGDAEVSEPTSCPDAYVRLVADVCRAIRERLSPEPSPEEALRTVEVVEAARRSAASGRAMSL